MSRIYKILPRAEWRAAQATGTFAGSPVDLTDGYIHFSTAAQAQETARRHFNGQADLVVLEIEADDLGEALRWEPSRGGDLFPHLYGALDVAKVLAVTEAPLGEDGVPSLGELGVMSAVRCSPSGGAVAQRLRGLPLRSFSRTPSTSERKPPPAFGHLPLKGRIER